MDETCESRFIIIIIVDISKTVCCRQLLMDFFTIFMPHHQIWCSDQALMRWLELRKISFLYSHFF